LEPVLSMLEKIPVQQHEDWEAGYVLLLWMSIIVKIPFDMCRLDGSATGERTAIRRIYNVCLRFLRGGSTVSAAAAYLTSCFMTRTDVFKACFPDFISWCSEAMSPKEERTAEEERNFLAALSAFSVILKHGKRDDLYMYAPLMFKTVLDSGYKSTKNSLIRKFGIKVVQRIGLVFLKPKVASWRYKRGSRSLAENLKSGGVAPESNILLDDVDEDVEVVEEVEDVIEELMQGLKDAETTIRWSAAKGIGRVTGRLITMFCTIVSSLEPMKAVYGFKSPNFMLKVTIKPDRTS